MKIRFNKMEGYTFIIRSKNERVALDRENHDIQIDTADSDSLVIERETTENILNKLYYFFLIIPVALVFGIGAGAIWHSDSAILGSILISSVIYFVSMNTYLNGRKRKLLRQLRNEL